MKEPLRTLFEFSVQPGYPITITHPKMLKKQELEEMRGYIDFLEDNFLLPEPESKQELDKEKNDR